jgi:diaminopimelate decarboxylase
LTDVQARELREQFGTPLYVLDERSIRDRIRQYHNALDRAYGKTELSYASKANSTLAVLKIAHQEGATIDVASEGELRAAMQAGIPASSCHLHGNNKKRFELEFALDQGVSHIAIDHFGEIDIIANILDDRKFDLTEPASQTVFLLRLAPGVDPKTHARISTGQSDTKFGFNITDGSAERALLQCIEKNVPVDGIHCHVGSQLMDEEAQRAAGEFLAQFAADMKSKHGFVTNRIIVGGGLGVKYLDQDEPLPIREYCERVIKAMTPILMKAGLEPIIGMEPGRSIIAEAGVTIYTVGVIKTVPIAEGKTRTFVAVDGGLSDNPRPTMYEAKYAVKAIYATDSIGDGDVTWPQTVTVCGKHCETDSLFVDVEVPNDIQPGDLLQVFTTGAYNSTMASNYNRYPRPATVLIRHNGAYEQVVRRDSWDEMFDKETVPGDL